MGFLITLAVTHIIPEAMEESDPHKIGMVILFSMLFLTFVEMFFFSGNKGKVDCCGHSHSLANGSFGILFGSSLHNFCDGMVIASAYLTNPALGFAVTVAVLSHEIAHELGDYAIMLDLGAGKTTWTKSFGKALILLRRGLWRTFQCSRNTACLL